LLGENGAGKSTLMRMCAGLLLPDAGDIRFGTELHASAHRRTGCLLEGSRNLYWRLTPLENLEYYGGLKGLHRRQARERAASLLQRFGLATKRAEPVQTLSRGMQQRLSVLCSLIHEPAILLLDEPTLGLDHESSALIVDLIREIAAGGVAVVISSHQVDLMQEIATDVAILRRGELIVSAPARVLLQGRESIFEVQVARGLDPLQQACLVAEFPDVRITGRRITVDNRTDILPLVLARVRGGNLVSVTRGATTLADVFQQTVVDSPFTPYREVQYA